MKWALFKFPFNVCTDTLTAYPNYYCFSKIWTLLSCYQLTFTVYCVSIIHIFRVLRWLIALKARQMPNYMVLLSTLSSPLISIKFVSPCLSRSFQSSVNKVHDIISATHGKDIHGICCSFAINMFVAFVTPSCSPRNFVAYLSWFLFLRNMCHPWVENVITLLVKVIPKFS